MILMLGVYAALSRTGSVARSRLVILERVEVASSDIDDEVVVQQSLFRCVSWAKGPGLLM